MQDLWLSFSFPSLCRVVTPPEDSPAAVHLLNSQSLKHVVVQSLSVCVEFRNVSQTKVVVFFFSFDQRVVPGVHPASSDGRGWKWSSCLCEQTIIKIIRPPIVACPALGLRSHSRKVLMRLCVCVNCCINDELVGVTDGEWMHFKVGERSLKVKILKVFL